MEGLKCIEATAPEMLDAMVKTYCEFQRLRDEAEHVRDMLYLDGVLSVLDVYMVPTIEKATKRKIGEVLEGTARQEAER